MPSGAGTWAESAPYRAWATIAVFCFWTFLAVRTLTAHPRLAERQVARGVAIAVIAVSIIGSLYMLTWL